MKYRALEIGRFIAAGASTTLFSYAVYLSLLHLLIVYIVAYPISFLAGIVWSYFVNTRYVFRRRPTLRGLMAFPLVYAAQLALGTAVVYIAVSAMRVPVWAGPLLAIAATLPMTYVMSRWIIGRTSSSPRSLADSSDRKAPRK